MDNFNNYLINGIDYLLNNLNGKVSIKFITGLNTIGALLIMDNGIDVEYKKISKKYDNLNQLTEIRNELLYDIINELKHINGNVYPDKVNDAKNLMLDYMKKLQSHYESQFITGDLVLMTDPKFKLYNDISNCSVETIAENFFKIYFNQSKYSTFVEIEGGSSINNIKKILSRECAEICEIRSDFLKDSYNIFENYHNDDKNINIETEWYSEKETPFTEKDLKELGFEHVLGVYYEKVFSNKKIMVTLLCKSHLPKLEITGVLIDVYKFNEKYSYGMKPVYEGEIKSQKHLCELLNKYGK